MSDGPSATILDLFDRYADGVFTLGYRLLGDRHLAEDVVQETFLSVLRGIASYREEGPIAGWLYRIAYRSAIAQQRKRRDLPTDPADMIDLVGHATDDVERTVISRELLVAMDRAISALTPPLGAAFVLREIEGLSTQEVAQALEISASSVKMRLARARKALRSRLKGYL
ncbi:MAG: RNA polymerase sigma factor [Actinobacteria bacterium]|nr:RNA polymerase sigma factor [Actinomycetota bacterium]